MCSPRSEVLPFLGRGFMAKHTPPRARNAGAAGLSSPLWFFPAVPSCLTGNFTVRSDARTREVVRRRMSPTNAAGPFLVVFPFSVPLPSARYQFCVAAMAVPSAFSTHTNTRNQGGRAPASPICDRARRSAVPSPRTPTHRRTCIRRAIDPNFEPFGHLDPEHRLA
jgi:hypothetical protein